MSYNQKIICLMTVFLLGITVAITFICFDMPFSRNFKISLGFILFAEFMLGGFWAQQIGKCDNLLPLSLGNWGLNVAYLFWVLFLALFTDACETKYFFLWQLIGLTILVVMHLFFRIAEHHVEEISKDEEPSQKIERADITWR